ncbi:MAG: DUF4344 domain-containing metallopeptidase [Geminicoccaceae bacterium]|nr:DUF4344 domain-containing metallopeptidase [Geminicoccaceae bacterium]MDW8124181.1 DUF4344 domain-containing metallopeptidase [Geminicoccaceae bacterium]
MRGRIVNLTRLVLVAFALFFADLAAGDPPTETEDAEDADVAEFVLANTLATFSTELARALIGELKLEPPHLMFEAVDELALLLLLPSEPDPLRDELVQAAVEGWAMAADRRGEPEEPVYWVSQGVDEQRFARLVCLLVGSDPETFADLARELGIEGEEVARCSDEYERTLATWTALLEPHGRTKRKRSRGGTIRIEYDDAQAFRDLRELVQKAGVLEALAAEIVSSLVLPRTLVVRLQSCGEENARWLPAERRIVICWELVRAFERLAREDAASSAELPADQK